jgi:hypothetical protein
MTRELQNWKDRNARLRARIVGALRKHPELREKSDNGSPVTNVEGPPPGEPPEQREQKEIVFLEEEEAYLQKRALAIIARRPDLEAEFTDML